MDDCFSLPNAAELVDKMRDYADTAEDNIYGICVNTPNVLLQAAGAIEKLAKDINVLTKENAKLKAERDAAVEDLKLLEKAVGKSIPKTCWSCELWGSNGWSQFEVGYCDGDDRPHRRNDFCSRWHGVTNTNVGSKKEEQ